MDLQDLETTDLFRGASREEVTEMLRCLDAEVRPYQKGETILRLGDRTRRLGLVLSGGVTLEHDDIWGNRTVLGHVGEGEVFAETYACLPGEPLMVNAVAAGETRVLFLDVGQIFSGESGCLHQRVLVRNLLNITARKNLSLSRRSFYTSSKTIRGRLLSYLSDQAVLQGSSYFSIPFDRQQLADYLGVDRSALSNELSKLRREGLVRAKKNQFYLLKQEELL